MRRTTPAVQSDAAILEAARRSAPLALANVALTSLSSRPRAIALGTAGNMLTLTAANNLAGLINGNADDLSFSNSLASVGTTLGNLICAPGLGCFNDTDLALAAGSNATDDDHAITLTIATIGSGPVMIPATIAIGRKKRIAFTGLGFNVASISGVPARVVLGLIDLPAGNCLVRGKTPIIIKSAFPSSRVTLLHCIRSNARAATLKNADSDFIIDISSKTNNFITGTAVPVAVAPIGRPPDLNDRTAIFRKRAGFLLPFTVASPSRSNPFSVRLLDLPASNALLIGKFATIIKRVLAATSLTGLACDRGNGSTGNNFPPGSKFGIHVASSKDKANAPTIISTSCAVAILPGGSSPILIGGAKTILAKTAKQSLALASTRLRIDSPSSADRRLACAIATLPDQKLLLGGKTELPINTDFARTSVSTNHVICLFSRGPKPKNAASDFIFAIHSKRLHA